MHGSKRVLALLLTTLFILCALAGCKPQTQQPTQTPDAPAQTAAPTAEPEPTEPPRSEASLALEQIDRAVFNSYVTSDALSYHLSIADPANFDFLSEPETGWGTMSYEDSRVATEEEKTWYAELTAIDTSALSEDEKLTYDTLEQYLRWSIEGFDYYYYGEILDTFVGLHSNLPLNMVFYDMDSLEDVEGYLTLLADTPRIMDLVLKYEQEKSAAGLFMTDNALDEVQQQLQDVIDAKDTLFLHTTFDEAIAEIQMDDAARAEFEARNDEYVDALCDSYQALKDGLELLRGTCTNEGGLCGYGEEGLKYFELALNDNCCTEITPEQARDILNNEISYQLQLISQCYNNDPTVSDKFDTISLSVGTTQENLDYLETLMKEYYPELPEHSITFMDCPSELEDQFSPAAYLIPPVDDPSENLIILNAKSLESETRYLDTLAHEGYPGHMYHYQYIRTLTPRTGLTRQVLDLTGYYESWSQAGEVFFDTYNTRFGSDYCLFMSANSTLGNVLLPALFSIEVNYFGATEQDIYERMLMYYTEEGAAYYAPIYYQYSVENPFYIIKYAMGFTMFQQKLREAQTACGYKFDRLEYNRTFLDVGPTYFNFIMPALDAYIEANKR